MRYVDEFRDPQLAGRLIEHIQAVARRPVRLMEFCGSHTHAIFRFGLRQAIGPNVSMRAGPGCPVCVTSSADLDRALALAGMPNVIITTFGDMMRVPGRRGTLQEARARGSDVRVVYSPMDALRLALENPRSHVIFLGVGFETTAPAVAATIYQAHARGVPNFSVFSMHKLTPPATRAVLDAGEVALDGILGPGHVSAIIGSNAWRFLPEEYGIPCAVAGFEPLDILQGIAALVESVMEGRPGIFNAYGRGVQPEGNPTALAMLERVFQVADAEWRGFGIIPASGLKIRPAFADYDAERRFPVRVERAGEPPGCRCGEVLRGVLEPYDCPLFRRVCTPQHPVGPCMVSAEGACSAYYLYGGEPA